MDVVFEGRSAEVVNGNFDSATNDTGMLQLRQDFIVESRRVFGSVFYLFHCRDT